MVFADNGHEAATDGFNVSPRMWTSTIIGAVVAMVLAGAAALLPVPTLASGVLTSGLPVGPEGLFEAEFSRETWTPIERGQRCIVFESGVPKYTCTVSSLIYAPLEAGALDANARPKGRNPEGSRPVVAFLRVADSGLSPKRTLHAGSGVRVIVGRRPLVAQALSPSSVRLRGW